MQITGTDVFLTRPGRNYLLVKIETNEGIVGWGDATLNGREKAVEAALEHHIFPELQGHSATRIQDIWQMFFRQTYWRGGPVLNSALSGVDMALWDIKGKCADLPVYELLGGRTREYADVYRHCGAPTTDEIIENCRDALARGIDHLRVNYHPQTDEYLDLQRVVESTADVRDALGPRPELIVDIHGRADPIEAARVATELEPVRLFYLEDPVRPENPDAFETIRRHAAVPLAMGELFTNPWEMLPLVERELVDYIRTDLGHIGGITPALKLAGIGEHHYVRTAFHGPPDLSPVGFAATVHVDLSIPNFGIQEMTEYERIYGERIADVFSGGPEFIEKTGGVDVSDEPGLGIEVNEDAARGYEYERSHLPMPRNPDGSVQDW